MDLFVSCIHHLHTLFWLIYWPLRVFWVKLWQFGASLLFLFLEFSRPHYYQIAFAAALPLCVSLSLSLSLIMISFNDWITFVDSYYSLNHHQTYVINLDFDLIAQRRFEFLVLSSLSLSPPFSPSLPLSSALLLMHMNKMMIFRRNDHFVYIKAKYKVFALEFYSFRNFEYLHLHLHLHLL